MIQKLNVGEIWLADLNPGNSTKSGKLKPVLIIQNQVLLDVNHPLTVIIPLTTNLINDAVPLRLRIKASNKLKKDSDFLIDQVRAIDNKRLKEGPFSKCGATFMKQIYKAILEVIGYKAKDFEDKI